MAGLLTFDPGMYPRRLIVEDARQHGIPILPLDVNASEINPADAIGIMADGQTVYASKSNLYVATPSYYDQPRNPSRVPGTSRCGRFRSSSIRSPRTNTSSSSATTAAAVCA